MLKRIKDNWYLLGKKSCVLTAHDHGQWRSKKRKIFYQNHQTSMNISICGWIKSSMKSTKICVWRKMMKLQYIPFLFNLLPGWRAQYINMPTANPQVMGFESTWDLLFLSQYFLIKLHFFKKLIRYQISNFLISKSKPHSSISYMSYKIQLYW
jgi:hypothetical protein